MGPLTAAEQTDNHRSVLHLHTETVLDKRTLKTLSRLRCVAVNLHTSVSVPTPTRTRHIQHESTSDRSADLCSSEGEDDDSGLKRSPVNALYSRGDELDDPSSFFLKWHFTEQRGNKKSNYS